MRKTFAFALSLLMIIALCACKGKTDTVLDLTESKITESNNSYTDDTPHAESTQGYQESSDITTDDSDSDTTQAVFGDGENVDLPKVDF